MVLLFAFSAAYSQLQFKKLNENFRNKQFISLKSYSILNSVMKSFTISLSSTWEVNHPFAQCIRTVCATHTLVTLPSQLSDQLLLYHGACVQVALILLHNGSKTQEW
jgi:hypothetical protein